MAISSQPPAKEYPVHYRIVANSPIGKAAGLDKDSVVEAEIILTIPQSLISRKLGALTDQCISPRGSWSGAKENAGPVDDTCTIQRMAIEIFAE